MNKDQRKALTIALVIFGVLFLMNNGEKQASIQDEVIVSGEFMVASQGDLIESGQKEGLLFDCIDSDNTVNRGEDPSLYVVGRTHRQDKLGITSGDVMFDECLANGDLKEYYCTTDDHVDSFEGSKLGYTCSGGKLVKKETCKDTDNGKDYYVKGTTSIGSHSETDSCEFSGTQIYEYYCSAENAISVSKFTVPSGTKCLDGRLVKTTGGDCTTHTSKVCYSGDVWWYNSCGEREDKFEECGTKSCSSAKCQTSGGGDDGGDDGSGDDPLGDSDLAKYIPYILGLFGAIIMLKVISQ